MIRSSTLSSAPGSASSDAANRWRSLPTSSSRTARSRSSSADAASSGAIRSSGASARSARAASDAAPSPSSGATADAAAAAASASSSTCRSRSRRASRSSSSPACIPSVASTRAWRSASRERDRVRVVRQLVEAASGGHERRATPTRTRPAARAAPVRSSASSTPSWNDGRPSRRCSNWPDMAMSRSVAAATSSRATHGPRVRACAAVPEDPAGDHEPRLALGPELGQRRELLLVEEPLGDVELGLDVGLRAIGAHRGRVGPGAEEEPDRLRENRLARSRLARDGVQSGPERELRIADEDEVLDAEAAQHGGCSVWRFRPRGAATKRCSPRPNEEGPPAGRPSSRLSNVG